MRVNIILECTSCHERTYLTSKNRRHNPDRLELTSTALGNVRLLYTVKLSNKKSTFLGAFFIT